MKEYKFIGVEYWGSGERTLSEFKKAFAKKIRPDKMKDVFSMVKEAYKEQFKK